MYLGQWGVSLDPFKQTDLTEIHIMQSNMVHNSSSTGMAAVVIAIAHKHTFTFKEQSILISRAVFANRLPRIGMLNGNNDSTACVCVGGGVCHHSIFFLIKRPVFTLSASFNTAWHYNVQCLTHTSFTPVLGGQSFAIAPQITQSTQVPHVPLNTLSRKAT